MNRDANEIEFLRKKCGELRAMIKKQNEEIESLQSELHGAKAEIKEMESAPIHSEKQKLLNALSEIYRWTQQRDIGNPRGIIAGLSGDQLTKAERVEICNQENPISGE